MFIIRRQLSPALRSRRWLIFAGLGIFMFAIAIIMGIFYVFLIHPIGLETVRSFHPTGVGLAALSAALISGYWFYSSLDRAFQLLAFRDSDAPRHLREMVFQKKAEQLLPIVALGGGTGLSSLLKGLKELPLDLTAIVTVTDDGGSSGRLRKELQILPPGDIRNCLVALSRSESLLSRLFQFRFEEGGDISGHSFGNLFIAAMTNLLGDFGTAVREASNILAIRGRVIPVTCENVQLGAEFVDGESLFGETAITGAGKRIRRMSLEPPTALANPEALQAIDQAGFIILGPGSLYTSVVPNLLVPDVVERINKASGKIIYICNIMTQPGETDGFSAADHVRILLEQTGLKRIDLVVVNSRRAARPLLGKYEAKKQFWVPPTVTRIEEMGIRVVTGDFLSETDLVRHDSVALARVILDLVTDLHLPGKPNREGSRES
jgi:uncharacterized cofD-like protein